MPVYQAHREAILLCFRVGGSEAAPKRSGIGNRELLRFEVSASIHFFGETDNRSVPVEDADAPEVACSDDNPVVSVFFVIA